VTLDFTGGDVIPPGGLQIDGGDGQDVVRLVGPESDLDLTDPVIVITNVEAFDLTDPEASIVTLDAPSVMALTPTGSAGFVGGSGDDIVFVDQENWLMGDPIVTENTFKRTVVNGDAMVDADLPFPFQNLAQRHDVSNEGEITVGDALRVINELSRRRFSDPETGQVIDPLSVEQWPGVYYDVDGNDRISALDALQIINEFARRQPIDPSIEGQSVQLGLIDSHDPSDADSNQESHVGLNITAEAESAQSTGQMTEPFRAAAPPLAVAQQTDQSDDAHNAVDQLLSDDKFLDQIGF
jgi:hypothetical protein